MASPYLGNPGPLGALFGVWNSLLTKPAIDSIDQVSDTCVGGSAGEYQVNNGFQAPTNDCPAGPYSLAAELLQWL
jgi:hypothetical protein